MCGILLTFLDWFTRCLEVSPFSGAVLAFLEPFLVLATFAGSYAVLSLGSEYLEPYEPVHRVDPLSRPLVSLHLGIQILFPVHIPQSSRLQSPDDLALTWTQRANKHPSHAETDTRFSDSGRATCRGEHTPLRVPGHAYSDRARFTSRRING